MIRLNIVIYDSYIEKQSQYLWRRNFGDEHYVGMEYLKNQHWNLLSLSINQFLKRYDLIPNKRFSYEVDVRDAWFEEERFCVLWRKVGKGDTFSKVVQVYKNGPWGSQVPDYPPTYKTITWEGSAFYYYLVRINLLTFAWESNFIYRAAKKEDFLPGNVTKAVYLDKYKDADFGMFHGIKIPINYETKWNFNTPKIREYEVPEQLFSQLVRLVEGKAELNADPSKSKNCSKQKKRRKKYGF